MKKIFPQYLMVIVLLLFACDRDRNDRGLSYWPDMRDSRAYETYSPNPNFSNGTTMQPSVPGTIPREVIPTGFVKTPEDRTRAGREVVSPIPMTIADVMKGKELFQLYCINCHGERGDGKGFLFTSGKFPYPPASLISDKLKMAPKGEVYHVITVGWGVMGAHGAQIPQEDRWRIVEYVKVVLQGE